MTALLERPRSPLNLMRREHKHLLDQLAPEAPTRVRTCATKLISYFDHWQSWKKSLYPSEWIYQPLAEIRHDLMDAHTIHVIRDAIALLQRLGFLSVRRNDRTTNLRNGQDRTHQYYLHSDHIEASLEQLLNKPEAETLETPSVKCEISNVNVDTSDFIVETHTQIPTTDSFLNSCSLTEAREKLEFLAKEEEEENSQEEDVIPKLLSPTQYSINVLQQNKDSELDKHSAPLQLKKPQNDLPTPEGWNEFYPQLLEYARREGKSSPAGWTSAVSRHILQELAAGRPHCLWDDFQQGVPLGFQDLKDREWVNPVTGEPWPIFVEVLVEHCQNEKYNRNKPRMAAVAEAADILAKPKKAALMWVQLKHLLVRLDDDWQRQKKLGVRSPALPPAFTSRQEPSLMEAAEAMQSLMPAAQADLPPAAAQQASLPLAAVEEPEPEPEPIKIAELQEKLNKPVYAPFIRMMAPQWGYRIEDDLVLPVEGCPSPEHLRSLLANPITAPKARRLIEANPSWGFSLDQDGHLWEF